MATFKYSRRLSRREMLRLSAALAAAGAVAACSPAATSPTAAPPTAAPGAPAATNTPASVTTAATATPQPLETFGNTNAKVKLRYWTILGSVDGIVMNDLTRKFAAENPDIAVESLQGLTDFVQKMQAAGISNTAPDVALVRQTYIGPFADKNILSPLSPEELTAAGINAADYDSTVWGFTEYKGQRYTIPLDVHCHAMLYEDKILKDNALTVPTTTDEWLAAVKKVTKGDIIGYNTFALGAGAQEFMTWYIFGVWKQWGVEMWTPDGTKAAFNTPAGVEATNWIKDMQVFGNPKNVATGDLQRTGQVFSWADGPWISTLFFDKTKAPAADDIHAAPFPQHDPAKKAVWGQSHQFALPRQATANPEQRAAALKFVQWMGQRSADWAQAGQIPAHNKARAEALGSNTRVAKELSVWASELPYVAYMPPHPKILEVLPRIAANVEGAVLGQWSVEEGLKKAEDEVNGILAS